MPRPHPTAGPGKLPRISVITPSYNQARFLEETIRSVLDQGYPDLEYIVMDGGSKDGTDAVLAKYRDRMAHCASEKDRGQAHAINKGLALATGDLICWLNSDDLFTPGTLHLVARTWMEKKADFIYGDGYMFWDRFPYWDRFPWIRRSVRPGPVDATTLSYFDPIQQPSTFWTRKVLDTVGPLDESLYYTLDWDFFIRIAREFQLTYVPAPLSAYRLHATHKTGTGGLKRAAEVVNIVRKYAPEPQVRIYDDLFPHAEEILALRLRWRRFFHFFLKARHPELYKNHPREILKLALNNI